MLLFNYKLWGFCVFLQVQFSADKRHLAQQILSCLGFHPTQFSQPCCPLNLLQAAACRGEGIKPQERQSLLSGMEIVVYNH